MNWTNDKAGEAEDPMVAQALRNFKASVDAWSETAVQHAWTPAHTPRYGWRMASAWALGCVLAVVSLSAGMYEHHHRQELTRQAEAARAAERVRIQSAQRAEHQAEQEVADTQDNNEDLLATVDSDISRQVPAAMEPLAQMMDDDGTAGNETK